LRWHGENVDAIVHAVLYEGFVLYPYRASSAKNRRRFPFGALFPPAWCRDNEHDACEAQCEVLVRGAAARTTIGVRFLHLRDGGRGPWQEAEERRVDVGFTLSGAVDDVPFRFGGDSDCTVNGTVRVSAERVTTDLARLSVRVRNETPFSSESRDRATLHAFASTHVLLEAERGEFVSMIDPPEELRGAAATCKNVGLWPVLVGEHGATDAMLASPIILYDYPQIATESPGDLFDATEIDEILTLRILTLTEEERREIVAAGGRARALLERTDALGERELTRLHGAVRNRTSHPAELGPGDRVRLAPRRRADVLDLALAGRSATIATVEEDVSGALVFTVTIDDDPGRDLGAEGLPGHRFFFHAEEVERIP
jgi:hypothetical protein